MHADFKKIDLLILCGGLGKRLRPSLNDRPKVLAEIGGRVFLDILIGTISQYSFQNIILSTGYLKEQIKEHFGHNPNYNFLFSEEERPLGTGGAVQKAKPLIKSNPFLVMNGDSICKVNLEKFYDFHIAKKAILSVVLARSKEIADYGLVKVDASGRIRNFREKVREKGGGLISAGIYLMQRNIFSCMPSKTCFSLESDLFSKILDERCYGFLCESELVDIGTPKRYKEAVKLFSNNGSKKGIL